MSIETRRRLIPAAMVVAYFVAYPEDLAGVLAPAREVLTLSNAVSPWLYGVIAVGLVAWAIVRCWGPGHAGHGES